MKQLIPSRVESLFAAAAVSLVFAASAQAQDNILIYGNSIIEGSTPLYFSDITLHGTGVAPNLVTRIGPNRTTSTYLADQGAITNSLPAGQTWDVMIVQGGTIETTTYAGTDPMVFHNNMVALAGAFFAHSPQGAFLGHETGADHPLSFRYPSWFPDPASWLSQSQAAYEGAREAIAATYPSNPRPATIPQGTVFASTAGYPANLFTSDRHHHQTRGQILDALLYYQWIYGGLLCDLNVDFTQSTPLVNRLMADSITPQAWDRLVGFADRSVERGRRPLPGTDNDFQLRLSVNTSVVNLCSTFAATAGDTLYLRGVSPLDSTANYPCTVYGQFLNTGSVPATTYPGFHLNRFRASVVANFADLTGGAVTSTIPIGMVGETLWLQASSHAASGSSTFPTTFSDAKRVMIQ